LPQPWPLARFEPPSRSKASVAQTHQFLAANDKTNLTPKRARHYPLDTEKVLEAANLSAAELRLFVSNYYQSQEITIFP
jgi:hypothetical protein